MKKILIGALLAAATVASPAMAQDNTGFTGAHIEALGGWDQTRVDSGVDSIKDPKANGFVYGLGAGYDFDTGGLVVGIEGEFTDSTAKKCVGSVSTSELCANVGRDLYVGGRVGTTVGASKNTLIYAKGGYTDARSKLTLTETTGNTTTIDRWKETDGGWRVGAGVETKTSNNILLKGEYRYSDYGDGVSRHQVLGGVGIRF